MSDAGALLERLRDDGLTIAVAESCTGGLLGAALTDLPGASTVFLGGVIAYQDRVKETLLDVPHDLLETNGAVSASVVEAMADSIRDRLEADMGIAVSGIAGPEGGNRKKPVGTVWISVVGPGDLVAAHRLQLEGGRQAIRERSVDAALRYALEAIEEAEKEDMVKG